VISYFILIINYISKPHTVDSSQEAKFVAEGETSMFKGHAT